MAVRDTQEGLLPSVLDRLSDPNSAGTAARPGYGLEQTVEAIRRDLEDLLNTHQTVPDLPPEFVELHRSLLDYGLPDLGSGNMAALTEREALAQMLEEIVSRFEPRLRHVRVTVLDSDLETDRTLRFRLEAHLNVEPFPEVAFDTGLEVLTGHYRLQLAGDGNSPSG